MPRIGVNMQALCQPISGIGRYSLELVSRLVQRGDEWVLFANRPILHGDWNRPNITERIDNFPGELQRHFWAQTKLPWRARQDKLDLFFSPTHRLPGWLPQNMARVVTIHDLVWRHYGETMKRAGRVAEAVLMPQALRVADLIMVDSASTEVDLHDAYPHTVSKTRVVHLGTTGAEKPGPASALIQALPTHYILFVGTLEPRKNLRRLLEAYAMIPSTLREKTKLVIAGGAGWGGVDISTWSRNLKLEGDVIRLGFVPDEDMPHLYERALCLAMPSLYEGFGLPLLEAMSHGTPVLTSDISSLPEVAGDAGLLVNPLSTADIAGGLVKLVADQPLRTSLAEKAKRRSEKFTWDATTDKTREVFAEALERRSN